jgi:hypothetical protein
MHLIKQSSGDPMLVDKRVGLRKLQKEFRIFLKSNNAVQEFRALTKERVDSLGEFLKGLRVRKSDGEAKLSYGTDGWLELAGGVRELEQFGEKISVEKDGEHRHWYGTPVSLIIESDDDPSEDGEDAR